MPEAAVLPHALRHFYNLSARTLTPTRTTLTTMPAFPSQQHAPSPLAARYRTALKRRPFLLFGLPFIATMVAGSFFLTPATALRYERHDRKTRRVTREEALGIGKNRRKVDMREEYYVSRSVSLVRWGGAGVLIRGFSETGGEGSG